MVVVPLRIRGRGPSSEGCRDVSARGRRDEELGRREVLLFEFATLILSHEVHDRRL